MAVAPPQTTATAPPQTAPPQACAVRRSGGEGGGAEASAAERRRARQLGAERRRAQWLGAEASAAARVRVGKRSACARVGEKKGAEANRFTPKSWLCVAHPSEVRYGYVMRGAPHRGVPRMFLYSSKAAAVPSRQQSRHSLVVLGSAGCLGGARFEPWTSHLFCFYKNCISESLKLLYCNK
jgi:hypothetical protein